MPVYSLKCPDCSNEFRGMVLAYTKPPEKWVCSKCLSENVEPIKDQKPEVHPWDDGAHGSGCLCCGGGERPTAGR